MSRKEEMTIKEIVAIVCILICFIFFIVTDEVYNHDREKDLNDRCTWCLKKKMNCRGHGDGVE